MFPFFIFFLSTEILPNEIFTEEDFTKIKFTKSIPKIYKDFLQDQQYQNSSKDITRLQQYHTEIISKSY